MARGTQLQRILVSVGAAQLASLARLLQRIRACLSTARTRHASRSTHRISMGFNESRLAYPQRAGNSSAQTPEPHSRFNESRLAYPLRVAVLSGPQARPAGFDESRLAYLPQAHLSGRWLAIPRGFNESKLAGLLQASKNRLRKRFTVRLQRIQACRPTAGGAMATLLAQVLQPSTNPSLPAYCKALSGEHAPRDLLASTNSSLSTSCGWMTYP